MGLFKTRLMMNGSNWRARKFTMANYFRFRLYVPLGSLQKIMSLQKNAVLEWSVRWSPGPILDAIKNNNLPLLAEVFERKNKSEISGEWHHPLKQAFIAVYGDGWDLWQGDILFCDKKFRAEIERLRNIAIEIFDEESKQPFQELLKFFETCSALSNEPGIFFLEVSY